MSELYAGNKSLVFSNQWRMQDCPEGGRFLAEKKSDDLFSRHTLDAHIRFKPNFSKPVCTIPTSLFMSL